MDDEPVGTTQFDEHRGCHRIGLAATARLTERRDMVHIDAQTSHGAALWQIVRGLARIGRRVTQA
jgi:hypothetical protein